MLVRTLEPAPSLIDVKSYAREVCNAIVVAQAIGQQVDKYRIELNPGDVAEAEILRRKQISAAADTNHRRSSIMTN